MKQTIVFATGNAHKLQEINEIAQGTDIEFILPPEGFDPIENGETFEENSLIKAREAARVSGMISLADDSGLCVEALGGAPGIHSARYAQTAQARIDKLLGVLQNEKNRKAKFVCVMTLVDKDGNILQVGDKVMTYIMKFNPTDKRIALSVTEPHPEEEQPAE